jgi:aryl-alcohol dehydrogenase-like predicted oxidoreductase
MENRKLGQTGVQVSAIGLGCMGMVGWYGERDDREARATLDRALELGITHLDTAAVYQDGDNERFVGECISGRRDRIFLATKCGMERSPEGRIMVDNRPQTIRRSCEESLRRLGTDYIDLFYLHRIDPAVPIADSMGTLGELVTAGKIRFAGLSEANAKTLRDANRVYTVSALQSELSLWTRQSARAALEVCRELGIAFVAYSPLGRGFLTGAIARETDLPSGDTRRIFPRFSKENLVANALLVDRIAALAASVDCTPAQLCIAWVLAQWEGVLPIPGTKKRKYLVENAGAVNVRLTDRDLDEIDRQLPQELIHGERYPEVMMNSVNA